MFWSTIVNHFRYTIINSCYGFTISLKTVFTFLNLLQNHYVEQTKTGALNTSKMSELVYQTQGLVASYIC